MGTGQGNNGNSGGNAVGGNGGSAASFHQPTEKN